MENENKDQNPKGKRGSNNYVDFDKFISSVYIALTNSSDPEIEPLLTKRGYPAADIAAQLIKLEALEKLNEEQKKEYGEQYEATKEYNAQESILHDDYIDHLALARIAFKNDVAATTTLGLSGRRKESKSGYAAQALLFYNGCLDSTDYKTALLKKGVTETELKNQKEGFEQLAELDAAQSKETGEAQAATKKRDAALHELETWYSDFKVVATIALKKIPQLREKLGWKE